MWSSFSSLCQNNCWIKEFWHIIVITLDGTCILFLSFLLSSFDYLVIPSFSALGFCYHHYDYSRFLLVKGFRELASDVLSSCQIWSKIIGGTDSENWIQVRPWLMVKLFWPFTWMCYSLLSLVGALIFFFQQFVSCDMPLTLRRLLASYCACLIYLCFIF